MNGTAGGSAAAVEGDRAARAWPEAAAALGPSARGRGSVVARMLAVYAGWIVCFEAVGRYASTLPTHDLTTALDRAIPFAPGWVWVYELCYVFPLLPLVFVRDEARLSRALLAIFIANVTAFAVYLLLPLAWPLPNPGPTLAGRVLALEQAADFHPGANKLPSMHVAFAWIVLLTCRGQRTGSWNAVLLLTATAISASTVLVKQHVVLDVVSGVAWALGAWWASARLLPAYTRRAADPRDAFRRVAARAGTKAVLATVALLVAREALRAVWR